MVLHHLLLIFIRGDSARFTNLSVGSITIDSATIDSAFVGLLRGNVLDYNSATIDSARITNLSGRNLNFDSADIISLRSEETFGDSARITKHFLVQVLLITPVAILQQ